MKIQHLPTPWKKLPKGILIGFFLLLFTATNAQTVRSGYQDGKLYFKLKEHSSLVLKKFEAGDEKMRVNPYPDFPLLNNLIPKYGITTIHCPFTVLNDPVMSKTYILIFEEIEHTTELMYELSDSEEIQYVELAPLHQQQGAPYPNDVNANQWYLNKINAAGAWNLAAGSPDIVVAIVDGGSWMSHSDLVSNRWVNPGEIAGNSIDDDGNGYVDDVYGYDVANNDNNPIPPSGETHGTLIAGCISASTNNGAGIASIGYNIKIMDVKVKTDAGCFCYSEQGVTYAIAANADIINLSYGSTSLSTTEQNLMTTAHNKGIILVAASGNYGSQTKFYPAAHNYVIAVGETDSTDKVDVNSDYGTWVDLMAPGINIYSTYPTNGYSSSSGTSFSSPIVAGTLGLLLSYSPTLTPDQAEACLKNGCDNIDAKNPSKVGLMGGGRLNAYKTLLCSGGTGISEKNESFSLFAYPNPSRDMLIIEINQTLASAIELNLCDVTGRIILHFEKAIAPLQFTHSLNTVNLTPGIYFLKVLVGEKQVVRKIVKE